MAGGRDGILNGIRRGLGRGELPADRRTALEARLAAPQPNIIPKRGQVSHRDQVALFVRLAEFHDASVTRVASLAEVPEAVARFLAEHNLPPALRMSPDASLDEIPWSERPLLEITRGPARPEDAVSVTPAFAGVAETGTLVLASGEGTPATLNFLPDNHVVVLKAGDVVGDYESAIARLRAGSNDGRYMPRTLNLVTGPSRTGDIEQELILGAHGPRRLHIVVVDDGEA